MKTKIKNMKQITINFSRNKKTTKQNSAANNQI